VRALPSARLQQKLRAAYSLAIPVALLLVILLLFCEQKQIDTRS
jgi:hypothetical protein